MEYLRRLGRSLLVGGVLILISLVPFVFMWLGDLSPSANVAGAHAPAYGTLLISLVLIGIGYYLMKRRQR